MCFCSMRSFPRGLWLSLKTISEKNKCVYKESVDSSSLKCPVDGQTFKDSHAQTLRVSCSNTHNFPSFDRKNIMGLYLMFFLGLNFPFYCKTAKYIPRPPSPEGFCWHCGTGSTVFAGAESTQHWPLLAPEILQPLERSGGHRGASFLPLWPEG